jgi:hypothetical protein
MTVTERAHAIATFRAVAVRLMELTAGWTPTTPEMEVKVLFGRHIWDFARHADALGKRTFELRLPEQASRPPADAYAALLADVAAVRDTAGRLAALYDAVLPGLERRYARYLAETDPILDGPSVLVLEPIVADLARQRREADEVRRELGLAAAGVDDLRRRDSAVATLVAPGGER